MSREMATSRESCDNVAGAVVRREDDMGSIGENHEALKARVAELEGTLAETRRLHGKAVLDGSAAVSRAERAEADNAALLGALRRIIDAAEATTVESRGERIAQFDWDPIYIAEDLVDAAHPGAVLLERLRALETFKAGVPGLAIIDMRRMAERGSASEAVRAALAAFDALDAKPCDECGMTGTHKLQCGRRG
jgi:hypothetical protein